MRNTVTHPPITRRYFAVQPDEKNTFATDIKDASRSLLAGQFNKSMTLVRCTAYKCGAQGAPTGPAVKHWLMMETRSPLTIDIQTRDGFLTKVTLAEVAEIPSHCETIGTYGMLV